MNGEAISKEELWTRGSAARSRPAAERTYPAQKAKPFWDTLERPRPEWDLKVLDADPGDPSDSSEVAQPGDRFRDRRLVQWLIAYLAVAWLGLQLMQTLAEIWDFPVPMQRGISLALALGALPALVVAWYHGELGRQRVCACEVALLTGSTLGAALAIWLLCFA